MTGIVIAARDKYDPRNYARCRKCGHDSANHSTSRCMHGAPPQIWGHPCDCNGWERDEGWPPPEYIAVPR